MQPDSVWIQGGRPLRGSVAVGGSKYSALGILPAVLLSRGQVTIRNLPRISDVDDMVEILKALGCTVDQDGETLTAAVERQDATVVPDRPASRMRASYYFLGALLATRGVVTLPMPRGDSIGPRPIDQHLKVLRAMGADVAETGSHLVASCARLRGAHIRFDVVTAGATIQALLAGVLAEGETLLENAHNGPFVQDVGAFLGKMGARIEGIGHSAIRIQGRPELGGAEHSLIPDQSEVATYLLMAAATEGDLTVLNAEAAHMPAFLAKLTETGAEISLLDRGIRLRMQGRPQPVVIETAPHPGFFTDFQPMFGAYLTRATGESAIIERRWAMRFGYAEGLRQMGADLGETGPERLTIRGVPLLRGASVAARDIRMAAAYITAALAARGESAVSGLEHLYRGYSGFWEKVSALGASFGPAATQMKR